MPKALSAEQIVSFRANGFLHPLNALNTTEVAHFHAELNKTETRLGGSLMAIDRKYRGNMHCCSPGSTSSRAMPQSSMRSRT